LQPPKLCQPSFFCCHFPEETYLMCCNDVHFRLPDNIGDNYNCPNEDDNWLSQQ
jgi:hypothetical protein